MKAIKDLKNKYRVLLTEVLPYELPLVLNNEAFYENMQDEKLRSLFNSIFSNIVSKGKWTIPFDYNIRIFLQRKHIKFTFLIKTGQLCMCQYM